MEVEQARMSAYEIRNYTLDVEDHIITDVYM